MSEIITVGLGLAKNVFQVHRADGAGRSVLRKKLSRSQVLKFFKQLEPCIVAMEGNRPFYLAVTHKYRVMAFGRCGFLRA